MTGSLIWLAFVGLITILYVKKLWILEQGFWPRHNRSAHGLRGDYLASCGAALFRKARF
jgi:hypothetical protein